jgi:uncharacterized protein YndB with AHSA1/START domain
MTGSTGACLVIADLSGYTRYLADVEIDHAQDILADLIGTVANVMRPAFIVSKLEGDAIFFYAMADQIDGSILMDVIEGSYFAFQNRLLSIRRASTCQCQACRHIGDLDLKVVAHHGEVVIQEMLGQLELVGSDVILVHRMLKNTVPEHAYAFLTDECVSAVGLSPENMSWRRHQEPYDDVGPVTGWVHDLASAWAEQRNRHRMYVSEDETAMSYSAFFAAPPELVWEHISTPNLRVAWGAGLDRVDQLDPSGRRRPGTVSHCIHGSDLLIQEFLDWRPPRYFTSKVRLPDGVEIISTHEVEPVDGGSVIHDRFATAADEAGTEALEGLRSMFDEVFPAETAELAGLLAEAVSRLETTAEPKLPVSDEGRRLATAVS